MMVCEDIIGVCSRSFSKNVLLRKKLLESFPNARFNDSGETLKGDSLVNFLYDCKGAIIALEYMNRELINRLPNLRYIGKYGVGLDKIDLDALDEKNIKLGWTPGVNSTSVAELTIALSLNIVRKIINSVDLARGLGWEQVIGGQLSSLTFGIIGCGHVGTKVAKLATSFGCNVLVCDIKDKSSVCNELGCRQVSFEEILSLSDLVSLHVPYKSDTRNLIDAWSLEKMKNGAYLVNTARGGIADEKAILNALDSGKLLGVALDVLSVEPPVDSSLVNHDRAIVTTHIGGSSHEAIMEMGLSAIKGLLENTKASFYKEYI
ncbi:hypothetical protein F9817_21695 [Vibrio sp. CAIM 722]|uniref:Phosphoglycerate dehydrogenase n=1 Tax=Vibrio eleionomae TaxID=2653505 RepID=A0A7X4LQ70_9VIBR|nr:phosphoglycerate dehydrogenase [Vibrio eleionomae]MZI95802.1 hypothetical protein [Vibrio eleionomae]